jgi:hypothetical protein
MGEGNGERGERDERIEEKQEGKRDRRGVSSLFYSESGIPGLLPGNCGAEPRQNANTRDPNLVLGYVCTHSCYNALDGPVLTC